MLPIVLFIAFAMYFEGGICGYQSWPDPPTTSLEDALTRWKVLESESKAFVNRIVKDLLPVIVRINSEAEVSPVCAGALLKLLLGIKNLQDWAVRMVDATGKPSGGQLMGTTSALGSHKECLEIKYQEGISDVLRGMYCILDIRPPLPPKTNSPYLVNNKPIPGFENFTSSIETIENMKKHLSLFYVLGFNLGVCLPSHCEKEDVQSIASTFLERIGLTVIIKSCEIKEHTQITGSQWIVLVVILIFLCVTAFSTTVEIFIAKHHPSINSSILRVICCFSLVSNTRRLFKISSKKETNENIACLNGMRFYSMAWVVLCHTYIFLAFQVNREAIEHNNHIKDIAFQTVINGTLSVDSFFFFSGLLLSFKVVTIFEKRKSLPFLLLLARRIWKLLPIAMLTVGLMVILPLLGSGPLWKDIVQEQADHCRENWWHIALFISNYVSPFKMCLMHSWYIALDLQFFVLGLVYILLFFRRPVTAQIILVFLSFISMMTNSLVGWYMKLIPAVVILPLDNRKLESTPKYTYMMPYCHLPVYATGLALGTILAKQRKLRLPGLLRLFGWLLATIFSLSSLFGVLYWTRAEQELYGVLPSLYLGIHRPLFGLGLAWVTFVCFNGYGGIINQFLSWKGYEPLNRLSYMVYLLHVLVIIYQQGSLRGSVDSTFNQVVWTYLGTLCMSFISSLVLNLLFETPLQNIETVFLEKLKSKNKKEETFHEERRNSFVPEQRENNVTSF